MKIFLNSTKKAQGLAPKAVLTPKQAPKNPARPEDGFKAAAQKAHPFSRTPTETQGFMLDISCVPTDHNRAPWWDEELVDHLPPLQPHEAEFDLTGVENRTVFDTLSSLSLDRSYVTVDFTYDLD